MICLKKRKREITNLIENINKDPKAIFHQEGEEKSAQDQVMEEAQKVVESEKVQLSAAISRVLSRNKKLAEAHRAEVAV